MTGNQQKTKPFERQRPDTLILQWRKIWEDFSSTQCQIWPYVTINFSYLEFD